MSQLTANVVICGAGIAGISAAYHLAVKEHISDVVLVDERAPLTLTSDKSTECYRNWWPGPGDAMVKLMNRSIDILEGLAYESNNAFHMNRRGYLFATSDPERIKDMRHAGEESELLGAGPLRTHPGGSAYVPAPEAGYENQPTGADLILDPEMIRHNFPYLAPDTVAVLHARRCGWLSAQTLGMYMLERAREHGVRFVSGRVTGVDVAGGRVSQVTVADLPISTGNLVIAAGPLSQEVASMIGVDLPVYCELHTSVSFRDDLSAFPRTAPLLIWIDPQFLPFTREERTAFEESDEMRELLDKFPGGVHARPEGNSILALWTYDTKPVEPRYPIPLDPKHPEIVLRGLATMIPALAAYFGRTPRPSVDGGYYIKTKENRPLIGPLPIGGTYIVGALSGFGIMASSAAGELVAAHVAGGYIPDYASAFRLERYQDPAYQALLANWGNTGQL